MTLSKRAATFASAARFWAFRAPLALLIMFAACQSYAWSEAGHVVIAEAAMQDVSPSQRDSLNAVARQLISEAGIKTSRRYHSVSAVALVSAWLDTQRGVSVEDIFSRYGRKVPQELRRYANSTTNDWHYSNKFFSGSEKPEVSASQCEHIKNGQLNDVLPQLRKAFEAAQAPQDQAIVLAMLVHLVADAHQPLHSITRLEGGCEHDRGGNGFCLVEKRTGRCELNLHRAWDQAFGAFQVEHWQDSLRKLEQYDTQGSAKGLAKGLRPEVWQSENFALATRIYGVSEGKVPDSHYLSWAQQVALKRAGDAAARLTRILSLLPVQ
jgi:hypothetical protein